MNSSLRLLIVPISLAVGLLACEKDPVVPEHDEPVVRGRTFLTSVRLLGINSPRDLCAGGSAKIELNGEIEYHKGINSILPRRKAFSTTPGKEEETESCGEYSVLIQEQIQVPATPFVPATTRYELAGSVDSNCNLNIRPGIKNFTITVPNGPMGRRGYFNQAAPIVAVCL